MKVSEVSDAQSDALEVLWENGGEIVTAEKVADKRDVGKRAAQRLLKRMAPELVTIDEEGSSNIYTFSDTGRDLAEDMFADTPYGDSNVRTDVRKGSEDGSKRLHGVTIQGLVQNSSMMPDEWFGVLQEKEDVSWISTQENDYQMARDIWILRFHKDAVTFQLRKDCSLRGSSSSELVRKLYAKADEISSWIEDVAGVDLRCRYFINRAELAFENLPVAQLADDLPGVPLDRFKTVDPDIQEQVFKLDASPGFPEGEAQGRNFERVAQAVESHIEQMSVNYDAHENRIDFENSLQERGIEGREAAESISQVSTLQEQMGETITKTESLEEKVEDVGDMLEAQAKTVRELQRTREQEKDTRDALIENVRAVNNLAQSNQELLQENVPRIQEALEVVPHQTELLEKLVDRVEELEEKVEKREKVSEPYTKDMEHGRENRESLSEVPGDASLVSISIETEQKEEGLGLESEETEKIEQVNSLAVDPSSLESGLRFYDLREETLLEVDSFELEELEDGFQDVAKIRVAGTLKWWHEIPRQELARLLGTGRFEFRDQVEREKEETGKIS